MRSCLALTVGDPAGIGPEIVLMAVRDGARDVADLVAFGSVPALERARRVVAGAPEIAPVEAPERATHRPGVLDVVAPAADRPVPVGELSAAAGEIAFQSVAEAVRAAQRAAVDGLVTAPLNKEAIALAGHPFPGHTEILAEMTGTIDYAMMLTAQRLRVVHVTTHIGLRDVFTQVTPHRVLTTIRVTASALAEMGIDRPRIGVAGLNPHAGEGGMFGDEEPRLITPAIIDAVADGIDVTGPWPPDTLFGRAVSGEFDAVIAMFHDQGHIAVKVLGFDTGVNATIGLPIVRTSVDHGTAFDIAGTGTASPDSLRQAIEMAAAMCRARTRDPMRER